MTLSRDTAFCCHSYLPKPYCFPTFGIHLSYFILHPSLSTVSRNQVSFVTGLPSYLIQPLPKSTSLHSPPKPPKGGCSNAARTGTSSFHPASLLRLLRNRPRLLGVRFSAGTGLLPRQSADPATSWRSNTSRHHVAGRTPSGCLLLQTTLRGVVWVERRPVQFRTITGIHRPAPGE